jgi:hypothetical protein
MTDLRQQAGLRTHTWIGGRFTVRDGVPIQINTKRFETKTLTSNLGSRIDRVFTLAGMSNIRNRNEFFIPYSDLREQGLLEHLDILANVGQPFGLGLWKQHYDVFDGDGSALTFYLQRRQLLPNVTPPTTFADYPTRITVYNKSYLDPTATPTVLTVQQKTAAEMAAGSPASGQAWIDKAGEQIGNLWVDKFVLNSAQTPPDASDCLIAAYLPLYEVTLDQESARSYAQSMVEPRAFKFSEFG